jgi:hypothetical protein
MPLTSHLCLRVSLSFSHWMAFCPLWYCTYIVFNYSMLDWSMQKFRKGCYFFNNFLKEDQLCVVAVKQSKLLKCFSPSPQQRHFPCQHSDDFYFAKNVPASAKIPWTKS